MYKYYAMRLKTLLYLPVLLLMMSCVDDDSTYGSDTMDISISGIDDIYNVVSFSDDALTISPTVTSSFGDDDLEYEWSYAANTISTTSNAGDTVRATVISHDKNLDYQSRLSDGMYNFFFKVTSKSTGYSQSDITTVYAASALSKGFYVLKENAAGNTDVDLWNTDQKRLTPDVLATYGGGAIEGKPLHLDVIGNFAYLDSINGVQASAPVLSITTDDTHDQRWIRIRDAKTVKTLADCHYEPQEGEEPYRSFSINQLEFLLTNNGVYTATLGYGVGTFGEAVYGTAGSVHAVATSSLQLMFYNPSTHSIQAIDGTGYTVSVLNRLTDYTQMIAYRPSYNYAQDIIFFGTNTLSYSDASVYAVAQSTADPSERAIYTLVSGYSNISLNSVRVIGKGTHFATATKYAVCGQDAKLLYALDGNKIYALDMSNETSEEEELTFDGLPSNEQITYIANKFATSGTSPYDYLVIGTQQGGTYHLYFYNTVGGKPDGAPAFTITGQGTMRNVEYTDPVLARLSNRNVLDD